VALALLLLKKANLLILDEPTNHLDYTSKQVLQNALVKFSGSLIIVSHDVDFLQPIVNKVVEIRRGSFKIFPGTIEYYLRKRGEEMMERDNLSGRTGSVKTEETTTVNRKDQKRLEAELRNKRYKATKHINDKIEKIESEIAALEIKVQECEVEMEKPGFFDNAREAMQKTNQYQQLKEDIEKKTAKWEALQFELEEIEKAISYEL